MTLILPVLAIAFAAFCVWLTVRIVNRRERWAKWTLVAVVGLPVLYVVSFGPACWAVDGERLSPERTNCAANVSLMPSLHLLEPMLGLFGDAAPSGLPMANFPATRFA